MIFKSRLDAAKKLSESLVEYAGSKDTILLGLAKGGVVLAAELARLLEIPFDLIMTRKIGAPFNPELAIGAITETGKGYFNEELIKSFHIKKDAIDSIIFAEKKEAERRLALYRRSRPAPKIKGMRVILVDDGIATGATMMAAARATRIMEPKEIIIACPVAPPSTLDFLSRAVEKIICLYPADDFMAVSQFYEEFPQTTDDEIIALLRG